MSGLFDSSAGVGSSALDCCGAEEAEAARFVPLLHAAKVSSSASAVKTAAILFIITLSLLCIHCRQHSGPPYINLAEVAFTAQDLSLRTEIVPRHENSPQADLLNLT